MTVFFHTTLKNVIKSPSPSCITSADESGLSPNLMPEAALHNGSKVVMK